MWGLKNLGAALGTVVVSSVALGQTAVDSPGFTFLEGRIGNSFRYSFEFDLPVGVSAMAFEFVSQTDESGADTFGAFKNVEAGSTSQYATIDANGWSVVGQNGDSTVFFMEGAADQRLSFDVVFNGEITDTSQWNIWFYSTSSRSSDYDPFAGWGVLDTEVTDPNLGGGGAPTFNPTTTTTSTPLPTPVSMALAGLAPVLTLRRRRG